MHHISYNRQPTSYPVGYPSEEFPYNYSPSTHTTDVSEPTHDSLQPEEEDALLHSNFYYTTASSSVSPVSWSSGAQQMNQPQFSWDAPGYGMGNYAPPFTDHLPRRIPGTPLGIENEMIDPFQFEGEDGKGLQGVPAPVVQPQEDDGDDEEDNKPKPGEPYARLIYKAFMSRKPHYSMTLQEIYQWFRDHTDKSSSHSKGWQNSIRHNLSMNAAFIKHDNEIDGQKPTIDTKKSTEWILEEWAIRDGVQSTTRYRKGNPARRRGAAKASPGRRGGVSKPKNNQPKKNSLAITRAAELGLLDRYVGNMHIPSMAYRASAPPTAYPSPPISGFEIGGYMFNGLSPDQTGELSQRELPQNPYQTAEIPGSYGISQERLETANPFAWNSAPGGDASYYATT
ncbi:hypothetical protein GGR58DRAFT_529072 [Xylaria digitata]|nr:hypothetical protein GGR58DRAFT_529072 [Xylaria digitata]